MTHRFPLKEVARQAGLSTATVDRAINNRAHVSPQTKARVKAAMIELEAQEAQLSARGRRLFFDFVIEAPARFRREVKQATQNVLPRIGVAVCRPRFEAKDIMSEADVVATLKRIAKRGSHGVCLKVRDVPAVRAAVDDLIAAGIPVVSLVTDLRDTQRTAYVGLDNHSAGRTAAFLIAQAVGDKEGTVLTSRSHEMFLGEEERYNAFKERLLALCPHLRIVDASGAGGVHAITAHLMIDVVQNLADLRAVYSMGGGNRSILDALAARGLLPTVFVAHDLDHENRELIAEDRIQFVLHHDLRSDLECVFQAFLFHHALLAVPPELTVSHIQVITPENVPIQQGGF